LTSDADTGEDKLEKGAKREKKTVWEVAKFYTSAFKNDLANLNIKEPTCWIKATDTIKEQIDLIKVLEKKGFTYQIEDGVYFDTSKLKNYGVLWGNKKPSLLKAGARACPEIYRRVEMVSGKKHPTDFALWKLTPKGVKRQMEWDSPWGKGFPGWHTECVVMSVENLGIPLDIHCGGIDHIQIHHTNEIAQAQAAYEKPLANYWLHGEFLNIEGGKISKSLGNIITLDNLMEKGLNPLALRYLFLTAHYRSKLDFSWQSLKAAGNALNKLYNLIVNLKETGGRSTKADGIKLAEKYQKDFLGFINNDLDMPKALALMWQMLNDKELSSKEKYNLAIEMDKIFGLGLDKIKKEKTPKQILELAEQREKHRKAKEWQKADEIRKQMEKLGFSVEDTAKGPTIRKIKS